MYFAGIEKFIDPWLGILGGLGFCLWFFLEWVFPLFSGLNIFSQKIIEARLKVLLTGSLLLGFLGWGMLTIAIMKPVKVTGYSNQNVEVRDVYFVVDVSRSMLANDFAPNRLEVAKKYIIEFIKMRGHDRIAFVMFAEKILTLSPLTFDHASVMDRVAEIKIGFLGNGTNIGDGVGLAVERLKDSSVKGKVIVLLTDGVSNVGNITPMQATKFAVKNDVKIYSIAIGSKGRAQIPYRVAGRTLYQNIPGGNVDEQTLRDVSKQTGGAFFSASNADALMNVFRQINKIEKTKIKGKPKAQHKHLYRMYLFWGALMLLISEVLRRKVSLFAI